MFTQKKKPSRREKKRGDIGVNPPLYGGGGQFYIKTLGRLNPILWRGGGQFYIKTPGWLTPILWRGGQFYIKTPGGLTPILWRGGGGFIKKKTKKNNKMGPLKKIGPMFT